MGTGKASGESPAIGPRSVRFKERLCSVQDALGLYLGM